MANELAVFQDRIRKLWHEDEWWFSVVDAVGILSGSSNPRLYWGKLKERLSAEGFEALTKCKQLKMLAADGKLRMTDCTDEATLQAIIRCIPRRAGRRPPDGWVYAIQPTAGGLVKLGYTTRNIPFRLGQIQNMCPIPLRVVWRKAGTVDDESVLHATFADRRQYGEWFDFQGLDVPSVLDRALVTLAIEEERAG